MQHITDILASGDFAQFIGMAEDAVLEMKRQHYDLATAAADRYELAKDVSALANSGGGYILIGLATQKEPERQIDVVNALNLIAAASFPIPQCEGMIDTHVYPRIEGLAVTWRQANGTTDGLGVIYVPPQREDLKPFIISKVVEDGAYLREIVIGYAERANNANDPLTPRQLYDAMKKGRDSHSRRLTRMEGILERLLEVQENATRPTQPVTVNIEPDQIRGFDEANLQTRINTIIEDVE
jgi:hypothetical protein